jgi:hypothetical protein
MRDLIKAKRDSVVADYNAQGYSAIESNAFAMGAMQALLADAMRRLELADKISFEVFKDVNGMGQS